MLFSQQIIICISLCEVVPGSVPLQGFIEILIIQFLRCIISQGEHDLRTLRTGAMWHPNPKKRPRGLRVMRNALSPRVCNGFVGRHRTALRCGGTMRRKQDLSEVESARVARGSGRTSRRRSGVRPACASSTGSSAARRQGSSSRRWRQKVRGESARACHDENA